MSFHTPRWLPYLSISHRTSSSALAVVMTGMGQDGLQGCQQIRAAGGQVLVQDEASSVVPATLLVKYFHKQGALWEISHEIRQMVEFREINLIHAWSFLPRMDVIFMRNILIYLDLETKKNILGRVARLLNPGGYLLLGGSETTTNLDDSFEVVSLGGATCFRLRQRDTFVAPAGIPIADRYC